MRKFICTFCFCLLYLLSLGQQTHPGNMEVIIEYDAAGNRTCRKVITLTSPVSKSATNSENLTEQDTNPKIDLLGDIQITAYPNPTTQKITLQIQNHEENLNGILNLYAIDGRFLQQYTVSSSNMEVDLSDYTSGIYILKLRINEYYSEWKIIKQ